MKFIAGIVLKFVLGVTCLLLIYFIVSAIGMIALNKENSVRSCKGRMLRIYKIAIDFQEKHNGELPESLNIIAKISNEKNILHCKEDKQHSVSYEYNESLRNYREYSNKELKNTILLKEKLFPGSHRHIIFLDGHVEKF